ncbi:MAG: type II toxin-antitoxin system RelE/ParE family toxin [Gammaproteobacteria bacterium]|nr:type II toxin-antitoxin system RelE/ParE family toxin [Gammaproteobacteria bacterium]
MAELNWTNEASRWVIDIHDYIAIDNPQAAQSIVSGIYRSAQILAIFPRAGYLHRRELDGEVRIILYRHYRIAYLLNAGAETAIDILGVFHGALDIDQYFP